MYVISLSEILAEKSSKKLIPAPPPSPRPVCALPPPADVVGRGAADEGEDVAAEEHLHDTNPAVRKVTPVRLLERVTIEDAKPRICAACEAALVLVEADGQKLRRLPAIPSAFHLHPVDRVREQSSRPANLQPDRAGAPTWSLYEPGTAAGA
mgnify:CR=1 FL=1